MTRNKVCFLFTLLLSFIFIQAYGQTGQSKITLKNGTEIIGAVKSINPDGDLVINMSGADVPIKMSEVSKIEAIPSNETDNSDLNKKYLNDEGVSIPKDQKLKVTDFEEYPDTFNLKVGSAELKMVLVRGGVMNMGYDGDHSRSMKSEPIHKVKVTSFYISNYFVTADIVKNFKKKAGKEFFYLAPRWEDARDIAKAVANETQLPVRLPTEAEWEYAACSPIQNTLFDFCGTVEYCHDFFGAFGKWDDQIDPEGPSFGKNHVIRAYNQKRGKFNRAILYDKKYYCYFRLAVKAKDVIEKLKMNK